MSGLQKENSSGSHPRRHRTHLRPLWREVHSAPLSWYESKPRASGKGTSDDRALRYLLRHRLHDKRHASRPGVVLRRQGPRIAPVCRSVKANLQFLLKAQWITPDLFVALLATRAWRRHLRSLRKLGHDTGHVAPEFIEKHRALRAYLPATRRAIAAGIGRVG